MSKKKEVTNAFLFIYKVARPFWKSIIIMVLTAIVWAVDLSVRPYIMKVITNHIIDTKPTEIIDVLFWPMLSYFSMSLLLVSMFRIYN